MRVVPGKFQLMGHTIRVVMRDDLWDQCEAHGRWVKHKHLIELQTPTEQNGMTQSFLVQTFWHEVCHAILDNIGKDDLSNDESFVDILGQCIHQVLSTKRRG